MGPSYRYRATVARVIDGDTYELLIDLGFKVLHEVTIRLRGVDAPELSTPEGREARDYVSTFLDGLALIVETHKTRAGTDDRSFARYVADVYLPAGGSLADDLVAAGHASLV